MTSNACFKIKNTEEFCQEFPCEVLDRTCTFIRYFREVWSRKSNITLRSQRESQDKEKRKEEEKETLGIPKRISIHVTVANVLLLSLLLFVNEASYSLNQIKYTRRGLLRSTAAASPLLKKKKVWSQMPKAVHVSIFIFSPSICKKHLFPPFLLGYLEVMEDEKSEATFSSSSTVSFSSKNAFLATNWVLLKKLEMHTRRES